MSPNGFHSPTMSFPVAGTLMVEPTESEPKVELDRLVEALKLIRAEIAAVEAGEFSAETSVLRNAPHSAQVICGDWGRAYSRESAAFPTAHTRQSKFWPSVSRIDEAYGDRNLICTCPPLSAYGEALDEA
jgi:glycine dehydrogenase